MNTPRRHLFVLALTCLGSASVFATTRLEGDWSGNNLNIPAGFGNNVAADAPGVVTSAGADSVVGTPDISLVWTPNGDGGWQTYTAWNGRGDVFQVDGSSSSIVFTPAGLNAVRVTSIDLDEWAGGGGVTADWSVSGPQSGTIASGTWTGDTGGLRETIAINADGAAGEELTLTIDQTGGDLSYFAADNLVFDQLTSQPGIFDFSSDKDYIDGSPATLSWSIDNFGSATSLTLDDGTGPVDVMGETDGSGDGSMLVDPAVATDYTLLLDGTASAVLSIELGEALYLDSDATVATAENSYEVTLSWQVEAPNATVSLFDGTSTVDVTADTDPLTGLGSRVVTVPDPSTTFVLDANASGNTASRRVLREQEGSAAFSIDSDSLDTDGTLTVSWTGAAGGATDWIGVYQVGQTPGNEYSTQWNYMPGSDGSMEFTGLGAGEYFVVMLLNDGYELAQGPLLFEVTEAPVVPEVIRVESVVRSGDDLTITWESKAGFEYDIYASDTLEGDPLFDWDVVEIAHPTEGDGTTSYTEDLSALPGGVPARRFFRIYDFEVIAP